MREDKKIMEERNAIDEKKVSEATEILKKYKNGKSNLERRVIENEQWWKMRHWEYFRTDDDRQVEPASAWLFNSIANKHADAMDNYPEPNVLARALDDEEAAESLSTIIPVILEQNKYDDIYSQVWWYKLKQGTGIKGIFWNSEKNNGLGDIDIKKCDILNLFWEPGITDIQESRNLFNVSLVSNEVLKEQYPEHDFMGNAGIDVAKYVYDDTVDTTDKNVVVDWYYKKRVNGRNVVHYVKYVNNIVLYASENTEEYAERGYYDHGLYPFVFDPLFIVEGMPCGFGYIDVMRDTQQYIDRLNKCIMENALETARSRYFITPNSGINPSDFNDMNKRLIEVPNLSENALRDIPAKPISGIYVEILNNKIDELKETSGNRDFSQGSTSNGVTAASAISALMEAGSKLSRDMIGASYRAFVNECYMIIELIRQFYNLPRQFRITGKNNEIEYVNFDNSAIKPQPQESEFGQEIGDRVPVFDIKISASKKATYTRMSQNELALQLYNLGVFNPEMSTQAAGLLEIMDFDGREKVIKMVKDNGTLYEQMMQMQQQIQQMAQVIDMLEAERGNNPNLSTQVQAAAGGMGEPVPAPVSAEGGGTQSEVTAQRARNAASVEG